MNEAIAALVRRNDPDRFLTALFAPPSRRDTLLVLYAFNHELARAPEVASDPTLALIRLQWWREVVEGVRKPHEVATPLSEAIASGALEPAGLLPLIEAREQEAYGDFEAEADWRSWLMSGPGGLAVAAAAALGTAEPERCRSYGAAYGVAGLLRSSVALARQQRCLLPAELLRLHGLVPEGFIADPLGAPAQAVLQAVAAVGQALLAEAPTVPRDAIPAVLPAVLARRDFHRGPGSAMPRGLGDRLAVMFAAFIGRVR
jgi:15-cis-phytoene synthase